MAKARPKYKGDRFTEKKALPYATLIGQVALTWNELHENLCLIFMQLMRHDLFGPSISVWQSSQADRAKRAMLDAALKALQTSDEERSVPEPGDKRRAETHKLIAWLLNEITPIEDRRNDAVHAPLTVLGPGYFRALKASGWGDMSGSPGSPGAVPYRVLSNVRAHKVAARTEKHALRDLREEYAHTRDVTAVLSEFAIRLWRAMANEKRPLPEVPLLPNRGSKQKHPGSRRRDSA
jgi:hypothetical protein